MRRLSFALTTVGNSPHLFCPRVCFPSHKKNTKKNRMKVLFAAVTEAREAVTGRRLCDLFMVKPSKKDYPDYYKVILEPMDLRTIEHNIRSDKYMTEYAMVEDMKLMFRNARHFNEEGSQVGSAVLLSSYSSSTDPFSVSVGE